LQGTGRESLARYRRDRLVRYRRDKLARYGPNRLVSCSPDRLARYRPDRLAKYRTKSLARYNRAGLQVTGGTGLQGTGWKVLQDVQARWARKVQVGQACKVQAGQACRYKLARSHLHDPVELVGGAVGVVLPAAVAHGPQHPAQLDGVAPPVRHAHDVRRALRRRLHHPAHAHHMGRTCADLSRGSHMGGAGRVEPYLQNERRAHFKPGKQPSPSSLFCEDWVKKFGSLTHQVSPTPFNSPQGFRTHTQNPKAQPPSPPAGKKRFLGIGYGWKLWKKKCKNID
jgi:hypothetical protein